MPNPSIFDQQPDALRRPTILDNTPPSAPTPMAETPQGELGRGLSSGLSGSAAAAHAAVGAALDYAGLRSPAASQFQAARESAQDAALSAPFVENVGDINGLSDVPKYVAGKFGEFGPMIGASMLSAGAGAALRIPTIIGAALPMVPLGAGNSILPHVREDNTLDRPASELLPRALARGVAEGAIQGIAPGIAAKALTAGEQVAAKSFLGGVAKETAKDLAIQGGAAPAAVVAGNTIEGKPTTQDELVNATVGGLAGLAPLAAGAHMVGGVKVAPEAAKQPATKPAETPIPESAAQPAKEPAKATPKDAAPDWAQKVAAGAKPFESADATDHGRAAETLRTGLADTSNIDELRARRAQMDELGTKYAQMLMQDERVPQETRDRVAQALSEGRIKDEDATLANYADALNQSAKDQEPSAKDNLAAATQDIKDIGKQANDAIKAGKEKASEEDRAKYSSMDTAAQTNLRDYVFSHLKDEYKNNPEALQSARSLTYTLGRLFTAGEEPTARSLGRALYHTIDDLVQDKAEFIKGLPSELKGVLKDQPERITKEATVGGSAFDTYINQDLTNGQRMQVARRFEQYLRGDIPDQYDKPVRAALAEQFGGEQNFRALVEHYGNRYDHEAKRSEGQLQEHSKSIQADAEASMGEGQEGPKPTFTFADDSGEPRGFTSKQGAFAKLDAMRAADQDFAKNHSVVPLREAADEHGGADELHKKVRADLEARAAQDEQHANEPVSGTSFTRGDRAKALRASMEDPNLLDNRFIIKTTDRDRTEGVATASDLKKMRTLDARKVRDPAAKQAIRDGAFQVEFTNGKRLTVNAESVWKTMAGKNLDRPVTGEEGDHAFRSRMFKEGIASILARPDVKTVHGADRADLLIDRESGLRFRNLSGSVEHGRAIAERSEQFAKIDAQMKHWQDALQGEPVMSGGLSEGMRPAKPDEKAAIRQEMADMRHRQEKVLNGPKDSIRKALAREVLERLDRTEARLSEDRKLGSDFYEKREGVTDIQKDLAEKTKEPQRKFEDTGDAVGELGKKGTPGALQAEPKNFTQDMFGGRAESVEGRKSVETEVKGEPRSDELMARRLAEQAKEQRGLQKIERDVRAGKTDAIIARAERSTNLAQLSKAMAHLQTAARGAKGAEKKNLERVAGALKNRVMDLVGERNAPSARSEAGEVSLDDTVRTAHNVDPELFKQRLQDAWNSVDEFVKSAGLDSKDPLSRAFSNALKDRLQKLYQQVTSGDERTIGDTLSAVANLFQDAVTVVPDGLETGQIYDLVNPLVDKFLRPLIPLTDEQLGALEKTIHDQLGKEVEVAVGSVVKDQPLGAAQGLMGSQGPSPTGRERISIAALIAAAFAPKGGEYESAQVVAHHEVMHAALARIEREYGSGITKRLIEAAQQPHIRDQVLNAPESRASRDYFAKNPEEMLVQAYGLWATGKLKLGEESQLKGFFQNLKVVTKMLLRLLTGDKALAETFSAVKRGELADRPTLTTQEHVERMNAARARGDLKYSKEQVGTKEWTQAERKRALEEAGKILGPDQKVAFEKAFDWSGKYDAETDTLHFSTLASDPASVAWHEAVHALFAKLLDPTSRTKLRAPLQNLANSGVILRQLEKLLKDHPEALKQIRTDEEERLAYMFQFHRAGLLRVGPETKTIFSKIMDFIHTITGTVSKWEQGTRYMDAIYEGKFSDPSVAHLVIRDMKNETLKDRVHRLMGPMGEAAEKLLEPTVGRLEATQIPALRELAQLYHVGSAQEELGKQGFLQERAQRQGKFENRVYDALKGLGAEESRQLVRELRSGNVTTERGKKVQQLLKDVFKYMQDANVRRAITNKDGKVEGWAELKPRADYGMPQIWNRDAILRDPQKFVQDMVKAGIDAKDADAIHSIITRPNDHDAINMSQVGFTPFNRSVNSREFHFTPEQLKAIEPYLDNDPVSLLTTYVHQATHRAEHSRTFGFDGARGQTLLEMAKQQGATKDELDMASKAMQAMDGTLGAQMDPKLRKITSGIVVYENVALLPFALFSSLVDPINAAARSGSWADARRAMVAGIKGLVTKQDDENYQMARTLGLISEANMLEKFGDLYNGMYMAKWLKGLNEKFFRYNGMESWNKSMRTAAMVAGERFMLRHSTKPNEHSERYLRELGVEKGDIKELADGRIAKTREQGLTPEQEERVQRALFRYVDDAVLRPNSAHRPIWGSDPHYNLIFHLKQYSFSYHETFIKRALHEADYGNYMPMWSLAAAVPFMDVVDTAQDLLFGGTVHHAAGGLFRAIARSGVLGTKNFALDAIMDPVYGGVPGQSFLGPAANHAIYTAQTVAGKHSPSSFFFRSIPAGGVFRGLAS